ncbi:PAS domain S-box protein [Clostridium sp. PL3]|uniref:histidine kinase n=1 Tax=Clostridium thailandense TaxID=2794346 RepID=A0A949TKG9_9CLOT|nr:ATP-binding protein [Clostridium thailandense]MBV7273975.1 PAS domain S-box protein [Clostridium thailandense]
MELYNSLDDIDEQVSIVVTNDIVTEVSQSFADMTEYSINELLNKTITKIFRTLRVGPDFNTENINKQVDYFIFTKSLEVRFVYIKVVEDMGRQMYFFEEKPNSRLESKLFAINKLLSDGHVGIGIYTSPDLTLIKANQCYLDVFDEPYNRKEVAIGNTLYKLVNWNDNNTWGRDIWENIIKSGEIFYGKEIKGLTGKWKNIYNDNTIIPIIENGEVKLVISIFENVTEKVLSRKKVEEQKKIIERQKKLLELEISDTKLLQSVSMELFREDNIKILYEKIIDAAMQIMHSQYATIQIVYPGHGNSSDKLQMLAYRGFELEAVKLWEWLDVKSARTTGCETLRAGYRIIVPNVKECEFMQNTEDLDVYLKIGINSIQSTPLCSRNGRIIGVLSNHWKEAHKPSGRELRLLDVLARQAADLIEQRQAEEKLRESEEKYRALFEHMNKGFFLAEIICDESGKPIDYLHLAANAALDTAIGLKRELIVGRTRREVLLTQSPWIDIFGKVAMTGEATTFEGYSEGLKRHLLIKAFSPKLKQFACLIEDITKRKKMEEELTKQNQIINEQKEQLQAIIENMSDGLSIFDSNDKYILFNKAARQMFFPSYSYMEKPCDGFYQSENFDAEGNIIPLEHIPANRIKRGEKFTGMYMNVKLPDKILHISVSGTPIYDANNKLAMGILCSRDISKIIEYEEKLKRQNEQLQVILDNMQEALFVFDKDSKYIIINKKAKECFSTSFDKIGDSYKIAEFFDLEGKEIPLEDHPNYRVKNGEVVKDKIVVLKLDGQKFYAIISGIPIFDEKGNFLYGVISGRNITEFMKSQQTLRETQDKLLKAEREKNEALEKAMEMKDEFLSLISHEFRTPLNVINTAIQTLNFVYAEQMTDKVKEYMHTIKQNTNRQLRLVNNLLDIIRANSGRIKINKKNIDIVFLTKAITESVYQYASHKGVSVTFLSTLTKKIIGIDDEKYERIILNLLSNAIKFTSEGKSIVVKLRSLKGNICVEVKDTGIGIPPGKLEVVFERFGQVDSSLSRQAEGTGIGLSLVKRFVEALGGSISVKSKVGKGTAFTILLPNETIVEEQNEKPMIDLMSDNRLVQTTHIEFSDIYL